jgi:putative transposase
MCMLVQKAFKFKLDLTAQEKEILGGWISTCRFLYNKALEHRILNYTQFRKSLNYYDQTKELVEVKKHFDFVKEVPAQALQQKLKDLDSAFQRFYKGRGFPKFKKKHSVDGIRFPDGKTLVVTKLNKNKSHIKLPKIGNIKFFQSREIKGIIRNATITRSENEFYISLQTQYEKEVKPRNENPIGIDRGVRTMAVTSEGESLRKPNLEKLEAKVKKIQKRLSKKKKFSKNFQKECVKLRKTHSKIVRVKRDNLHKVTTRIANNHGVVVLENLQTKKMTRSAKGTAEKHGKNVKAKSGLNRAILQNNWYEFETLLKYKLEWSGGRLVKVDPKFTSQSCNRCGHTDKANRKVDSFKCLSCGHKDHADINSAKNILGRGTAFEPVETVASGRPQKRAVKVKSAKQEPALGVSPSGILAL